MTDSRSILSTADIAAAGLADWQVESGMLSARFPTKTFNVGLDFVNRIGAAAEVADHHPDITLTYGTVAVTLISHDVNGITVRDTDLAGEISSLAKDLGVAP